MPDIHSLRLRWSASLALRDGKVDSTEAKTLIDTAATSAEAKNELKAQYEANRDRFDPAAASLVSSFLGPTPGPTPTPSPAPGPVTTSRRDLEDPAVLDKHRGSMSYAWNDTGELFVNGVGLDDVIQGRIANCYMVGAFAAVAQRHPELIQNAFKDNGDGTYTVRFFEKSYSGPAKEVFVTVDGQVPAGALDKYGRSRDSNEMWVGLLEKAYAQWKGGYEAIGNGGFSGQVLTALTGKSAEYINLSATMDTNSLFDRLEAASDAGAPMTAGTHGKDQDALYSGTNLYAWHVYTITGTAEENGEKYVLLRNPWGKTEPGSDGVDDGSFRLPIADFAKFYSNVNIAQ